MHLKYPDNDASLLEKEVSHLRPSNIPICCNRGNNECKFRDKWNLGINVQIPKALSYDE
jgi:hypothetical protein